MSMYYANDEHKNLVHISSVEKGLACHCTCFQCNEIVIAKKGQKHRHHFAHASSKVSCVIHPESLLHKYAKEVIQKNSSLNLPKNINWKSEDGSGLEGEGLVDFDEVIAEKSIDSIRPDLTATLHNSARKLYIEIVVTNPPSEEKIQRIHELQLDTIVINLNELITPKMHIPSEEAEKFILDAVHNKHWIYPIPPSQEPISELEPKPSLEETPEINTPVEIISQTKDKRRRFKIFGMFVNVNVFDDGGIYIRAVYNPQLVEIFSELRWQYNGRYNSNYKSWNFRYPYSEQVLEYLASVDEEPANKQNLPNNHLNI